MDHPKTRVANVQLEVGEFCQRDSKTVAEDSKSRVITFHLAPPGILAAVDI